MEKIHVSILMARLGNKSLKYMTCFEGCDNCCPRVLEFLFSEARMQERKAAGCYTTSKLYT